MSGNSQLQLPTCLVVGVGLAGETEELYAHFSIGETVWL